jgi:hypothetical protein
VVYGPQELIEKFASSDPPIDEKDPNAKLKKAKSKSFYAPLTFLLRTGD